jgi:hypothetical protein
MGGCGARQASVPHQLLPQTPCAANSPLGSQSALKLTLDFGGKHCQASFSIRSSLRRAALAEVPEISGHWVSIPYHHANFRNIQLEVRTSG